MKMRSFTITHLFQNRAALLCRIPNNEIHRQKTKPKQVASLVCFTVSRQTQENNDILYRFSSESLAHKNGRTTDRTGWMLGFSFLQVVPAARKIKACKSQLREAGLCQKYRNQMDLSSPTFLKKSHFGK